MQGWIIKGNLMIGQVGEEILDPHPQGRLPVRRASAGFSMGDKTQKVHQDPTNLQVEVHTKCSL